MNKITILTLLLVAIATKSSAVCPYEDCRDYVTSHKILLQNKLSAALNNTDSSLNSVQTALSDYISAIEEQNAILDRLKTLSIQNNTTQREIDSQTDTLTDLVSDGNKLEAKKAEALQMQAEKTAISAKIKSED